ncbi:hypothetical protein K438DRAFT_2129621 [Mycena galopus ATCC 62051]|nr:hypothetical protein K438DRAFT_2129621 [Mycena galopus ATCC 62051]
MPESQVLQTSAHVLQNVALDAYKSSGLGPDWSLMFFPRAFAEGTSNKPYQTLTLDNGDYSPSLEPIPVPVNDYDVKCIPKMAPWRHMIDWKRVPGPLQFAVHLKYLVIAAGYCVKANAPQADGGKKQEQK